MVQTFECEHCGRVLKDVWHDEETGMALCDRCIATKAEWNKNYDETPTDNVIEAIFQAMLKAYNIPNPRNSADGPDIQFVELAEEALADYVQSIIDTNDWDLEQVLAIIGKNPTIRPS